MKDTEASVRVLVEALTRRSSDHLDRAVAARAIAEVATRLERVEVMAAREDGATWATIADVFGITTQTAHERFRSGPDGLHSRFDQRRQSNSDSGGSGRSASTAESSAARKRRSTRS